MDFMCPALFAQRQFHSLADTSYIVSSQMLRQEEQGLHNNASENEREI